MEPQNHQNLLLLSLLLPISLIVFPSATAVSIPTAAPSPSPSLEPSTVEAPTPPPTPSLEPSMVEAPTPYPSPSLGPSTVEAPTPSPVPSQNYISFPPSSNPPSQPASGPASSNHALESICKSTDYPDLCISTISPFLDGPTDPETVVGIAIKGATEHTKIAVSLAAKLALAPSPLASVYGDCKDSYDDALENFESAMNALAVGDVGTMNSMLSAAITDFSDCDDGLLGKSSSLLDVNSALSQMTSNCLAIVSLIH
ncbi:pectinesterase inhibitor 10 [Rhododendron vialii]|uniref:pectinesterase inhibitor 10 n=1 Tax=Rhododendron vialii TaxID=182163 RepID=UPI00265F32A5|nr:pectinesterase inhibitor 10 [Rhododendron vialii]